MKSQDSNSIKIGLVATFLSLLLSINAYGMIRALNTAASGMAAQESNVNTIANNIANTNTIGFKKSRTEFEDLLYQTVKEAGSRTSGSSVHNVGTQIGTGAKVSAVRREFTQGNPQMTNRPFDFMIKGEGFFGVILPNGELRFTRDGSFNLDNQGSLVTKKGYRIFPGFSFPPGTINVNVSETGIVDAYLRGQTEAQNVGSLPLFTFINPAGLKTSGGNLYQITVSSGNPIQNIPGQSNSGHIEQGALEASNVVIMNEMTNLIKAQRAYEMNSKVMGVADQMLQTINSIR